MAGGPPSEIYYAAGPDGGPPEMDPPPPFVQSAPQAEAPPPPGDIQWYAVDGRWVGYPVAYAPEPAPEPEEVFQRYMPDPDGGPPCGGRMPVKAVPVEPTCDIYCSGGCCDCIVVEEAPPPPPECDYYCGNTCGTSCCGHWYDAPPPPPVLKKAAPPPPPSIEPCSNCTLCCTIVSCTTCSTTPCAACAPPPEPKKIIVKVRRPNRVDFPMDPNMQYLGGPAAMTTVMIVHGSFKPWDNPGVSFEHSCYEIDSLVTIRNLCDRLGIPPGQGVCECIAVGNGHWIKADEYVPMDRSGLPEQFRNAVLEETCDKTLEEVGWEGKIVWLLLWP